MRVLQVLQPPDGGVAEHVRVLGRGLVMRGHEVTVAGPADAACRASLEAGGARYVPVPLVPSVPAPAADRQALPALRALVAETRPAVVHVHAQKAGLLARPVALRAGVPVLYTPHSLVYRTQLVRPRRSARARYLVTLGLERALGRRSAAIVAVCEDERRAAIADGLAPADRVHTVLNGVAVDREAVPDPRLVAFAGGEPLLGFVAGLRDQKGLPVLLDALERLADGGELPRTAIVGNGPEAAEVDRRLADPRLAGRVTRFAFTGPMEHHLAALDLFVLPSLWEGLPIALLEAMAMGVAPVASAVGGTPEAVDDGRTGWLVPPGDAGALAGRLRAAMADGALRERVAAAAQAEAAARFGLERMVDELEALYVRVARA